MDDDARERKENRVVDVECNLAPVAERAKVRDGAAVVAKLANSPQYLRHLGACPSARTFGEPTGKSPGRRPMPRQETSMGSRPFGTGRQMAFD